MSVNTIKALLLAGANRVGKFTVRNAADNADIDPLAESTFTGRVGEVQASPTANTVLDRLKALLTELQLKADLTETQPVSVASVPSHAVTNAGTFAVQDSQKVVDNAAFTDGTTPIQPLGFIYDEVAGTALTENDAAAARVNLNRAQVGIVEDGATRGRWATVTAANALKVDASGVAVPITDNSGSLTVDNAGTFAVQATLAAGAAAIAKAEDVASADADVGVPSMAVRKATPVNTSGTDGDYEMLQISAGRLWASATVDAALPAGTNNIGDVDVLTVPADPFGANADAIVAAGAVGSIQAKLRRISQGLEDLKAGITALPSQAVTNAGTFATQAAAAGDVAHDAVDSGNPAKMGAQARTTDVTAVASADRVNAIATILGKLIVKLDAVPDLTWVYAAPAGGLVTTGAVTIKAAGASGVRNYLKSIQVINSHATISTEILVRDGAAGTVLHRGWAQAAGGGYACVFDPPLRGTAATLMEIVEITATGTAGVLVDASGFVAAE